MQFYILCLFILKLGTLTADCVFRARNPFSEMKSKISIDNDDDLNCHLIKSAVTSIKGPGCSLKDDQENKILFFLQNLLVFLHISCSFTDVELHGNSLKYSANLLHWTDEITRSCYLKAAHCFSPIMKIDNQNKTLMCNQIKQSIKCVNNPSCTIEHDAEQVLLYFIQMNPYESNIKCDFFPERDSKAKVNSVALNSSPATFKYSKFGHFIVVFFIFFF